jgi:hypothetical protein
MTSTPIEQKLREIAAVKAECQDCAAAILKVAPEHKEKIADLERRHLAHLPQLDRERFLIRDGKGFTSTQPEWSEVADAAIACDRLLADLQTLLAAIFAQQETDRIAKLTPAERKEEEFRDLKERVRVLEMQFGALMQQRSHQAEVRIPSRNSGAAAQLCAQPPASGNAAYASDRRPVNSGGVRRVGR